MNDLTLSNPSPPQMGNPRKGYRIWEIAASLGVGRTTVYGLIRDRKLKATKIGGLTLILASELEAFLARCQEESTTHPPQQSSTLLTKDEDIHA